MQTALRRFIRDESGEDLIEYGLLASFVAAVALATIIMDPAGVRWALVLTFRKLQYVIYQVTQN